jgi:hypothetical protein
MRDGIYYTCVIPVVSWLFLAELEGRVVSKVLYGSGCGRGRKVLAVSSKGFFVECPSGRRRWVVVVRPDRLKRRMISKVLAMEQEDEYLPLSPKGCATTLSNRSSCLAFVCAL